jgi:hypothetical protein
MSLSEAQKRYQASPKGLAARARYMEKRKARLAAEKAAKVTVEVEGKEEDTTEKTPKSSLIN